MKSVAFLQVFVSLMVYGILLILFIKAFQKHNHIGLGISSGLIYLCCNWIRFSGDYLSEKWGGTKKTEEEK